MNAVDINGKFKINAITNDILKVQKVDGSILYDVVQFSFNTVDQTNMFKLNNIDILSSLASKASSSNVYIYKTRNK